MAETGKDLREIALFVLKMNKRIQGLRSTPPPTIQQLPRRSPSDQYKILRGSQLPTPPLTHHFVLSKKLVLAMGQGRGR